MKAFIEKINTVMDLGAKFIMITMVLTITIQIAMRYIFNSPLKWSEELARFSYGWFCLFGIALVTHDRAHLTVSFLVDRFPRNIQYILDLFSLIIMLIVFLVVSWSTLQVPEAQGNIRAYSLGVPFYFLHMAIIPGFVASAIFTTYHFYQKLKSGKRSDS